MTTWIRVVKVGSLAIALLAGVPAIAAPVAAGHSPQDESPGTALQGTVQRIDGDLAIVDLGAIDGLERGDRVTLYQDIKGQRVRIGEARVVRVADEECQVGLRRLPKGSVRPGDVVVAEPAGWGNGSRDVPPEPPAAVAPAPAPAIASAPTPVAAPPAPRVAHDPATRVRDGEPLQVTLVVTSDPPLASAVLQYRTGRSRDWTGIPLERTGDAGWTATIPGDEVREGSLAYHVRGTDAAGRDVGLFASERRPWKVAVDAAQGPGDRRKPGVFARYEWQDFYLSHPNRDTFWRAELGFEYRFRRGALHSLRGGFGAMEGVGGNLADVESDRFDSRPHRGLAYVFVEPVLRFGKYVRWTPRLMLGGIAAFSGDRLWDGMPTYERGEVCGGLSSLLEFGPEDRFSIGLKGEFLVPAGVDIALVSMVQVGRGFQAGLSIGATKYPVLADWAGQIQLVGGWHGVDWMSIDAKFSINVKSIEHAGVGGGLGLSFWW